MNKSTWLPVLTIAVSLLVTACASPHARKHQDPDPERMVDQMSRYLKLSDEQDQVVRDIVNAYQPELHAVCEDFRDSRDALIEYRDPGYDAAAVRAEAGRLGAAIEEGAVLLVSMRVEIRGVLEPDQIERLESFRERRMENGHRPRYRHHRMRHGLPC